MNIELKNQIILETRRQSFTTKLHQAGIKLTTNGGYEFEGLEFKVSNPWTWSIGFQLAGKLVDDRMPRILARMFESMVMWERAPEFGGFEE